jgi:endonuclease/exonuclease/phosphatase (EEP) superfamily protein YafD
VDLNGLRKLKHKLEYDPVFQTTFHIRMAYFWLFNMVAAVTVFIFAPGFWAQASVLYLVIVSLYANFATDYGAASASEASEHTSTTE